MEPIYEVGNAYPVGYVQRPDPTRRIIEDLIELDDDGPEWLAKKRASIWYECENCGWMTNPPPEGKFLSHQCPDGTIPSRFVVAKPFDEYATGEALKGLLKILDDQTVT